FCDAMIQIRKEAEDVVTGQQPKDNNLLVNAPHTMTVIASDEWNRFVSLMVALFSRNRGIPLAMAQREEVLADSVPH
ncbi:hypothetical protein C0992_003377, partial [Termitomyces sp. T32_za158]